MWSKIVAFPSHNSLTFRWIEKLFQNSSLFLTSIIFIRLDGYQSFIASSLPWSKYILIIHRDHFAPRKTYKAFSMIAIYQPHNQNIAVIKAYRGTIGLTEDKYI